MQSREHRLQLAIAWNHSEKWDAVRDVVRSMMFGQCWGSHPFNSVTMWCQWIIHISFILVYIYIYICMELLKFIFGNFRYCLNKFELRIFPVPCWPLIRLASHTFAAARELLIHLLMDPGPEINFTMRHRVTVSAGLITSGTATWMASLSTAMNTKKHVNRPILGDAGELSGLTSIGCGMGFSAITTKAYKQKHHREMGLIGWRC